ncbi:Neprosin [Dillenia turbinata]|uniref:Neprosin n=1 Tax=Dillenia turbinata TaxID=194707 RepID=A0AAN8YZT6_9MAGN
MTSIASTLCALVFVASLLTHDFAEGRPTKGTLKTIMRDGYEDTGCYDLNCPGFVQTTSDFTVGIPLQPVSTYNQQQYDIEIVIHQDKATKHWWVTLQGIDIGYYPAAIFTGLWESASLIQWGGEIDNVKVDGYHTITQMGSGHFPIEGYAKASYFRHVSVVDESNTLADASFTGKIVTNPPCYDLLYGSPNATYGTYFYYGGPGFSATCRRRHKGGDVAGEKATDVDPEGRRQRQMVSRSCWGLRTEAENKGGGRETGNRGIPVGVSTGEVEIWVF